MTTLGTAKEIALISGFLLDSYNSKNNFPESDDWSAIAGSGHYG